MNPENAPPGSSPPSWSPPGPSPPASSPPGPHPPGPYPLAGGSDAPLPDAPGNRPRRRAAVAGAAWGGAAVALIAGLLVFVLVKHLNSTSNVRVIVPAPATAGDLRQDYADENTSQFRAVVAALRHQMAVHVHGGSLVAAVYTNAPTGLPARDASTIVLYLGVNSPTDTGSAADNVKSVLSGVTRGLTRVTMARLPGGPGDTTFECVTGTTQGRMLHACAWATDRLAALLVPLTPGLGGAQLAALSRKMEPDLVRG